MILTEEQRAAIHAVSGLLTAIGCPQCHSYLQKNYTHHIEVLRAMIDSSEHFTDASKMIGFDLERAREAIEEAVDRLSQKIGDEDGPIWEKEPEKAAVLQTLLDEITHLEKWMIKNRDAATELQYQLDDAVKENERLRADNAGLSKAVISIQEERDLAQAEFRAYHKAWEEQAIEIERLQLELTQALKDLSSKDEIIEKLKKEFLKSTYERNKIRRGHAWYPGDEDYNEYLQRIDADAHKKSQESLDDVLRGN